MQVWSHSPSHTVGAATELIRVTQTALVVGTSCRCVLVGAAAVRSELAAATLVVQTYRHCLVIRTTAERGVLATTTCMQHTLFVTYDEFYKLLYLLTTQVAPIPHDLSEDGLIQLLLLSSTVKL